MGYNTYTKCYQTSICPVTDYGAEIWGSCKSAKYDPVFLKAIRVFLGVNKFTATLFLEGEMGWTPPEIRRKICMLRYWNRLVRLDQNRLTYTLFLTDYNNGGYWCDSVRKIFEELELSEIYLAQAMCDIKLCEKALLKLYADRWTGLIKTKPKLRTYCDFKTSFGVENYIKLNLLRPHRSTLAQLRSGTLPLQIEVGRFLGKKLEERLCTLCQDSCVETEYHFLFHCSQYNDERNLFLNSLGINNTLGDQEKITLLLKDYTRALSKYVYRMFNKRQGILFM